VTEIKILKEPDVLARTGVRSHQHLHQLIKAGKFPAPIKLACRSIGWVESEINAWLQDRIAERDARIATLLDSEREPARITALDQVRRGA
jgi:prophage regulatory protein